MAVYKRTASGGFTLIELMVTVVVVGILAAVAYPVYTSHVQRSRRGDAVAMLSAITQAQERYRNNRTEYARSMADLGMTTASFTPHYTVAFAAAGNPASWAAGYTATATPVSTSPQATDSKCASMGVQIDGSNLTYVASDAAGNDARSTCWPR